MLKLLISTSQLAFADDIRDIKPPLNLGYNYWLLLILLLIAIILLFGLIWYLRNRSKRKKRAVPPPPLPHEIAFERLAELRNKKLAEKGFFKEFYFELSDIVRRYIEARFSFRAPEMTTEEFLHSLKRASVLSDQEKELLKLFLVGCDMVKFAKYRPTLSEANQSLRSAEEFIVGTKEEPLVKREGLKV